MRHQTRLLDILDRAENGPIMDEHHWDMFFVPQVMSELCSEFDIDFSGSKDRFVPDDDALAVYLNVFYIKSIRNLK